MERVTSLPSLPERPASGHKGTFGTVLVVGGSRGMAGAVSLTGRAALAGGAGLVRLAVPDRVLDQVAVMAPPCTTMPLRESARGGVAARAAVEVLRAAESADVLALGPGLGPDAQTVLFVRSVLENTARPTVLDADGLNAVARIGGLGYLMAHPETFVVTPHPGEAARLLRTSAKDVQRDREASATALAESGAVALLKGQGTVVTDGRRIYVNRTGNAGMATGGAGDVLTGLVAALLAQGMEGFEAAVLAAHVHGRAGDLAAEKSGQRSMTATDILHCLASALLL